MRRLALALALCLLAARPVWALDGGRYGEVKVAVPDSGIRGYVVYFDDRGGWTPTDQAALDALAAEGALTVGVDTDAYLARIAPGHEKCDQLVGDAEMLSRQLQREHSGSQYSFPILTGRGAGGTLAGAVLAEAPANTLGGAVSLDPAAALASVRPICPGAPARDDGAGNFAYGPVAKLFGFWVTAFTANAAPDAKDRIAALKAAGTPVDLVAPPETDDGSDASALAALVEPHLFQGTPGGVADLPLVELAADQPTPLLAIVMSGDGGWRDLDKTIADDLQGQGVNVVGWDSLRYFWRKKTPEETAADLETVIDAYSGRWHAEKVALVGFSFGADVLPFAFNLLPEAMQHRVTLISLLAFAPKADWEITVAGWLGAPASSDAVPALPALEAVSGPHIQCIYGQDEDDTACPGLDARGVEVIRTTGGHHFDGDYDALARRILAAFRR